MQFDECSLAVRAGSGHTAIGGGLRCYLGGRWECGCCLLNGGWIPAIRECPGIPGERGRDIGYLWRMNVVGLQVVEFVEPHLDRVLPGDPTVGNQDNLLAVIGNELRVMLNDDDRLPLLGV